MVDDKTRQGAFRLPIEGRMTSREVEEVRETIAPLLDNFREIEIDLSRVSEIDLAGLQLMVDMKLAAAVRGIKLHFTGHSQPVIEILATAPEGWIKS